MKITKVVGREIYDSRGWPTVQCELEIDNSAWVTASVPTGISKGSYEAAEIRDGGTRLWGRGVLRAIEHIEYIIGPAIIGLEPDGPMIDTILINLDTTADKSHLGANALLAVSMAVHRAHALIESCELFELIAEIMHTDTVTIPFPQFNLINGGLHAHNKIPIQEFLIVPVGMHHFRSSMELSVTIFHELKQILEQQGYVSSVGDEGGFAPHIPMHDALISICDGIQRTNQDDELQAVIALDIAASQLYNPLRKRYTIEGTEYTHHQLIDWYEELIDTYPIYSLEDPMAEDDWEGWKHCFARLSDRIQIIGDDLCVTNTTRIQRAIDTRCISAAIIKPNQVGTVTETLNAIRLCHANTINPIISHRSGETNDTFIVDLAVGANAGQIKAGGCCRGERIAKYNRLLWIEDYLFWGMLNDR